MEHMGKTHMKKIKVVAVVGPTASGKSALGVKIAKERGGEVISVDSRQVYKGLDIGTGKVTKREMRGVPHHLLDVMSPKKTMSAHDFALRAERAINDIHTRGKLPILVGGTGFWLDALIYDGALPDIAPNQALRKKLEKKSSDELYALLEKKDSDRAAEMDPKNKRRLIRSLEIADALGRVPKQKRKLRYSIEVVMISLPKEELRKRIHDRLHARMKRGMIAEAKRLHQQGLSWRRMEELGLEYRYLARYLQGKVSKERMLEELEAKIWQYAKRQMRWFAKNSN
jgi:tRNA dimethylallyltransferase